MTPEQQQKVQMYQAVLDRGLVSQLSDEQRVKLDALLDRGFVQPGQQDSPFGKVDFEPNYDWQALTNNDTNPVTTGIGRSLSKTGQALGQIKRNIFNSDEEAEAYRQQNAQDTKVWDDSASTGMKVAEVGGDVSQFLAPATGIVKAGQTANASWKSMTPIMALFAGGEDALLQTGEGANEFDKTRLALAAGFGAGGELIAPWASKLVSKFRTRKEGNAVQEGAEIVKGMGGNPTDYTNGQLVQFSRDARELSEQVTDAAKKGRAEFDLHYTAGEQTGDFNRLAQEEATRGSTSDAGAVIRASDELRDEKIAQATQAIQEELGQGTRRVGNFRDAGDIIQGNVRNEARLLDDQIDAAYTAVREGGGGLSPEALKDLPLRTRNAAEATDVIIDDLTPATQGALKRVSDKAEELNPEIPMDYSSRMQRAKEQGFSEIPYFHGTKDGRFDEFKRSGGGELGGGVYVTKKYKIADDYSREQYGAPRPEFGEVKQLRIKGKMADVDRDEYLAVRSKFMDELQEANGGEWKGDFYNQAQSMTEQYFKDQGYVGFNLKSPMLETTHMYDQGVVFDPKNIRLDSDAFLDQDALEIPINKIESIRKNINSQIGKAANKEDKRAAMAIKREFDLWLDDAADNALFSGDLDALKKARKLRAKKGEKFESSGPKDDGGKFIVKVLDEGRTPEEVVNYILGSSKFDITGNNGTRIIQQLKKATGDESEAILALKEAAFVKLVTGRNTPDGIANTLGKTLEGQRSFLNELYSPEELAKISRFKQALDVYKKDGTIRNNSNSAQMLGRMFESFTRTVPWITGNPLIGVGAEAAGSIATKAGTKRAQRWTQPLLKRQEFAALPTLGGASGQLVASDDESL